MSDGTSTSAMSMTMKSKSPQPLLSSLASLKAVALPTVYFHGTLGDTLWFASWAPSSAGSFFAACFVLFVLGVLDRFLAAVRAMSESRWQARYVLRLCCSSQDLTLTDLRLSFPTQHSRTALLDSPSAVLSQPFFLPREGSHPAFDKQLRFSRRRTDHDRHLRRRPPDCSPSTVAVRSFASSEDSMGTSLCVED